MLNTFIDEIEEVILEYRNFDLFYNVLTKENDKTNSFMMVIKLSKMTLQRILTNFDVKEFSHISKMFEMGFIIER